MLKVGDAIAAAVHSPLPQLTVPAPGRLALQSSSHSDSPDLIAITQLANTTRGPTRIISARFVPAEQLTAKPMLIAGRDGPGDREGNKPISSDTPGEAEGKAKEGGTWKWSMSKMKKSIQTYADYGTSCDANLSRFIPTGGGGESQLAVAHVH